MKTLSLPAGRPRIEVPPAASTPTGSWTNLETDSIRTPLLDLNLRTILVPFDFSDVSVALLWRMVAFADRSGAALHILHVVEPSDGFDAAGQLTTRGDSNLRVGAAQSQLQQWVKQTLPVQVAITTTAREGLAADEIVAQARDLQADLVVMSAHVGRGLKNALVRTTTERVVRHAPCPVLVLAKNKVNKFLWNFETFPLPSWKRILLPVDLSSRVSGALAYAAAMAMENSATLQFLHVTTGDTSTEESTTSSAGNRLTEWLRTELRWPVESEAVIWTNTPLLHAILAEARRSSTDVIVLPTRDCTWSRRHRFWSVTDGILRHAPCPVLCVSGNVYPWLG